METTKKQKTFDAVKMMRDIRDKISLETQGMTFEELKAYIEKKLKKNKSKLAGQ
jgi:hypothetical protein